MFGPTGTDKSLTQAGTKRAHTTGGVLAGNMATWIIFPPLCLKRKVLNERVHFIIHDLWIRGMDTDQVSGEGIKKWTKENGEIIAWGHYSG